MRHLACSCLIYKRKVRPGIASGPVFGVRQLPTTTDRIKQGRSARKGVEYDARSALDLYGGDSPIYVSNLTCFEAMDRKDAEGSAAPGRSSETSYRLDWMNTACRGWTA